jgi:PAS domain S-box-containing protein
MGVFFHSGCLILPYSIPVQQLQRKSWHLFLDEALITLMTAISLLIALAEIFLANYLFYKDSNSGYHRLAAGRALMLSLFCLFSAFFYASTSNETAITWNQVRAIPLVLLPVFTFQFTWSWTLRKNNRQYWISGIFLYAAASVFIFANFFFNILGYPVREPVFSWITVTTNETAWPLLFTAWAILLVALSIILAISYYMGIKIRDERKRQVLVFLGLTATVIPVLVIGLLPIAGLPDALTQLPLWVFISDVLIASGLSSRYFFTVDFSSAYYPVIQSMAEAAALLDLKLTLRAVNSTFCRLVGRQESELIGQPVEDVLQEDQLHSRQIHRALIEQGANSYTCDLNIENGKKITAGLTAIPVFDKIGRLGAIALLITDQTLLKAAQEKLKTIQAEIDQQNEALIEDLKKTNKMLESDLQQSKEEGMQWRRQVFENEALASLSSALRTARTIQEMLSVLLAETTRIFDANSGLILLKYSNSLVVKSLNGLPEELKGFRHPPGEDRFWQVFNSGIPSYISDIKTLPGGNIPPFMQGVLSSAIFPLKTAEKQLGLMVLGFNHQRYFNEFDQRLLSAVGNIASNALYRSNMIDSLEQSVVSRNRELETLFRITTIANEAWEPKTVLEQALNILLETLSSKLGVIYIHGKTDEVSFAAQDEDYLSEILGDMKEITLEDSIWGFIYRTNQPLMVDSLDDDRRIDIKIVTELIVLGNCALIGTPIRGSSETLGAIVVFRDSNQPYLMDDLSLLGAAAHQLGIAVEIINLRKQDRLNTSRIERQRQGVELYDSISQRLSSSFLYAEASSKRLQSGDTTNLPASLEQIRQSSLQALKDIRVLIHQLRPASLENLGLYGAIQHRLDTVERRAHIEASLSGEYGFKLTGNMEESLYQIVEDALNYSAHYSQATEVNIRLESDYDSITLVLNDNGNGQHPVDAAKKSIFSKIQERIENLGGKFELDLHPGEGMSMRVTF